jgi:hypothetical protein
MRPVVASSFRVKEVIKQNPSKDKLYYAGTFMKKLTIR